MAGLRVASLISRGRDVASVSQSLHAQAAQFCPAALLWMCDSDRAQPVADAMSDCASASVGAVSKAGLIGGGIECDGSASETVSAVALAIGLPDGAAALPFVSTPHGLPELPWATFAAASAEETPHMLLVAAPPRDGAFPLERWLGMLDVALPWAAKVGGLTAGSSGLFMGNTRHDGGAVGLALQGVDLEARSFQGAVPIGPAALITACDGNLVRELDGRPVDAVLGETIARVAQDASGGNLMCGISVPTRAAALAGGGACTSDEGAHEYVVRAMLGYSKAQSILAVGASPELLSASGARLQLHQFSADAARAEMRAGATTLKGEGTCGGFMVSCLGRGEPLYGEAGVETAELKAALGDSAALAGFFAGGEVGPVGARTFVHTYTTTIGLLRDKQQL